MGILLKEILKEDEGGITLPGWAVGYSAIHMFQPGFSFQWRYQKRNFKSIDQLLKVMHSTGFVSDKRQKQFQAFIDTGKTPYIFIDPYNDDVNNEKLIDWGKTPNEARKRMEDSADEI